MRGKDGSVGGHAVALAEDDKVATNQFGPGNPFLKAIADHQSSRTGQVAQAFEDLLGAGLLHNGDQHRGAGEHGKDDGLLEVAQDEVDHRGAEQQREHRLAQYLEDDAQETAPVGLGKSIGSLGL
jgi:hypothetical protein